MKPTLNQQCTLKQVLRRDEALNNHYQLDDIDNIIEKMTLKQYKYLLYLIYNDKRTKLNQLMSSLNFKQKYEK